MVYAERFPSPPSDAPKNAPPPETPKSAADIAILAKKNFVHLDQLAPDERQQRLHDLIFLPGGQPASDPLAFRSGYDRSDEDAAATQRQELAGRILKLGVLCAMSTGNTRAVISFIENSSMTSGDKTVWLEGLSQQVKNPPPHQMLKRAWLLAEVELTHGQLGGRSPAELYLTSGHYGSGESAPQRLPSIYTQTLDACRRAKPKELSEMVAGIERSPALSFDEKIAWFGALWQDDLDASHSKIYETAVAGQLRYLSTQDAILKSEQKVKFLLSLPPHLAVRPIVLQAVAQGLEEQKQYFNQTQETATRVSEANYFATSYRVYRLFGQQLGSALSSLGGELRFDPPPNPSVIIQDANDRRRENSLLPGNERLQPSRIPDNIATCALDYFDNAIRSGEQMHGATHNSNIRDLASALIHNAGEFKAKLEVLNSSNPKYKVEVVRLLARFSQDYLEPTVREVDSQNYWDQIYSQAGSGFEKFLWGVKQHAATTELFLAMGISALNPLAGRLAFAVMGAKEMAPGLSAAVFNGTVTSESAQEMFGGFWMMAGVSGSRILSPIGATYVTANAISGAARTVGDMVHTAPTSASLESVAGNLALLEGFFRARMKTPEARQSEIEMRHQEEGRQVLAREAQKAARAEKRAAETVERAQKKETAASETAAEAKAAENSTPPALQKSSQAANALLTEEYLGIDLYARYAANPLQIKSMAEFSWSSESKIWERLLTPAFQESGTGNIYVKNLKLGNRYNQEVILHESHHYAAEQGFQLTLKKNAARGIEYGGWRRLGVETPEHNGGVLGLVEQFDGRSVFSFYDNFWVREGLTQMLTHDRMPNSNPHLSPVYRSYVRTMRLFEEKLSDAIAQSGTPDLNARQMIKEAYFSSDFTQIRDLMNKSYGDGFFEKFAQTDTPKEAAKLLKNAREAAPSPKESQTPAEIPSATQTAIDEFNSLMRQRAQATNPAEIARIEAQLKTAQKAVADAIRSDPDALLRAQAARANQPFETKPGELYGMKRPAEKGASEGFSVSPEAVSEINNLMAEYRQIAQTLQNSGAKAFDFSSMDALVSRVLSPDTPSHELSLLKGFDKPFTDLYLAALRADPSTLEPIEALNVRMQNSLGDILRQRGYRTSYETGQEEGLRCSSPPIYDAFAARPPEEMDVLMHTPAGLARSQMPELQSSSGERLNIAEANRARELQVYGLANAGAFGLKGSAYSDGIYVPISLEPLGPDGRTIRDPRPLNVTFDANTQQWDFSKLNEPLSRFHSGKITYEQFLDEVTLKPSEYKLKEGFEHRHATVAEAGQNATVAEAASGPNPELSGPFLASDLETLKRWHYGSSSADGTRLELSALLSELEAASALMSASDFPRFSPESDLYGRALDRCVRNGLSLQQVTEQAKIMRSYLQKYGSNSFLCSVLAQNFGELAPLDVPFNRLHLNKTNGAIIPLGGKLTGTLVRLMKSDYYAAWKEAFDAGLPVEPILLDKQGRPRAYSFKDADGQPMMRVYTRYSGQRMEEFLGENPQWWPEIRRQRALLEDGLEKLNIDVSFKIEHNLTIEMVDGKPLLRYIDFDDAYRPTPDENFALPRNKARVREPSPVSVPESRIDLSQDAQAVQVYKLPIVFPFEYAKEGQIVRTPEGDVSCHEGDAILPDSRGGRYPIPKDEFEAHYDIGVDGPNTCASKGNTVFAKQMDAEFTITLSNHRGQLTGAAGDWLLQDENGSQRVVSDAVYKQTYANASERAAGVAGEAALPKPAETPAPNAAQWQATQDFLQSPISKKALDTFSSLYELAPEALDELFGSDLLLAKKAEAFVRTRLQNDALEVQINELGKSNAPAARELEAQRQAMLRQEMADYAQMENAFFEKRGGLGLEITPIQANGVLEFSVGLPHMEHFTTLPAERLPVLVRETEAYRNRYPDLLTRDNTRSSLRVLDESFAEWERQHPGRDLADYLTELNRVGVPHELLVHLGAIETELSRHGLHYDLTPDRPAMWMDGSNIVFAIPTSDGGYSAMSKLRADSFELHFAEEIDGVFGIPGPWLESAAPGILVEQRLSGVDERQFKVSGTVASANATLFWEDVELGGRFYEKYRQQIGERQADDLFLRQFDNRDQNYIIDADCQITRIDNEGFGYIDPWGLARVCKEFGLSTPDQMSPAELGVIETAFKARWAELTTRFGERREQLLEVCETYSEPSSTHPLLSRSPNEILAVFERSAALTPDEAWAQFLSLESGELK